MMPGQTTIHVAPPMMASPMQSIRPVFNVIPNPGSADALRRVQNQMASQRVAMNELKENLGYVRQVVDGLKAQLALTSSGKKSVTFKDMARLKKYIDINRASVKTLQDKSRELDLQVRADCRRQRRATYHGVKYAPKQHKFCGFTSHCAGAQRRYVCRNL